MNKRTQALKLMREWIVQQGEANSEVTLRDLKKGFDSIVQEFHRRYDVPNTCYVELTHNEVTDSLHREYRAQWVDPSRPADVTISLLTRVEFLSRQGIHHHTDLDDVL